ncbi:MAG TPA: M20/M25/M40 family metallo-hydrolase [Bryobacteraceae bacterium]|nr:M20/M25/M40 family metallo-hydrolase [Bryobacteraceae bacterium]
MKAGGLSLKAGGLAVLACAISVSAQDSLGERALRYLTDLVRIDTSNPPGNETRVARYLKRVADEEGIGNELVGGNPARLNFVARLGGAGDARPLLLMAHSDVVPAEPANWTAPPFSGLLRDRFLYGRGTVDDKSLLAAELAVVVELKHRSRPLRRDVILLSESDEEAASTGIQWLVRNAWGRIDAEFALNEGGFAMDLPGGPRVYQIQTAEKVPTPVLVRARGTAAHGSLPRPDNPVLRVARAITRLAEADQPVRLNATTRRYFAEMSKLDEYRWLAPLAPRLERAQASLPAADEIRQRDPELDAQLRTTVSPDVMRAGSVVNVIPTTAEAQVDVRRLPNETREEVLARLRKIVHDSEIELTPLPGHDMPSTEPSSLTTSLYQAMESVFHKANERAVVVPYMQRGATDGSYLRQKGMAVYGVPLFLREDKENRAHGSDERISPEALEAGTRLLWEIVGKVACK